MASGCGSEAKTAILALPCVWNMNLCFKDKQAGLFAHKASSVHSLFDFFAAALLISHSGGKIPRLFEKVCLCAKVRDKEGERECD